MGLRRERPWIFAAINEMVRNDPEFAAKEAEIGAREDALVSLKGASLPDVSAKLRRVVAAEGIALPSRSALEGHVSLNLYAFGRDQARWKEFDAAHAKIKAEHTLARLEAEVRASRQIFDWRAANDELLLIERIRLLRLRLLKIAEQKYNRGLLSAQDKQKIELDLEAIVLDQRDGLEKLKSTEESLHSALGSAPATTWPLNDWGGLGKLAGVPDQDQDLYARLQQHPRIVAAEAEGQVQAARTQEAFAEHLPTLDFQTDVEFRLDESVGQVPALTHSLVLTIPLLDGLKPSARYRSQQKQESAAGFQLESIKRDLLLDVKARTRELQKDFLALKDRDRVVQSARVIYESSVRKFEMGLLSVNDLSVDEARLYTYERDRNEGERKFHLSLLAYCQGNGWNIEPCLRGVLSGQL